MERNLDPPDGTRTGGVDQLRAVWSRLPVLPVLRVPDAADAVAGTATLVDAGLEIVELTATTDGWEGALERLRASYPDLLLGLGTVRDAATARRAVGCGARFVVTPYAVPAVSAAVGDQVPVIQGGWTPAELAAVTDPATGCGIGKLFPARAGGPQHLADVLAVLPGAQLVPTGGISLDDVESWLEAGALAVGVGSALLRDLERDPAAVTARLAELRAAHDGSPLGSGR